MKLRSTLFVLPVLAAAALWATEAPRTITIGGFLADEAGAPLEGAYAFRVDLYASTGDTALETADTTATLTAGTFNLVVPASDSVLAQEEIRYRLWADVDRDGLTETDRFPNVFTLAPVPRAHRSEPVTLLRQAYHRFSDTVPRDIIISAVSVPPNGVRFNTIALDMYPARDSDDRVFQFGVYDETGDLVAHSPALPARPFPVSGIYQVTVPPTLLQGRFAYFAFVTNHPQMSMQRFDSAGPPVVEKPLGKLTSNSGTLPPHIDEIANHDTLQGPALILQYMPETETLPVGSYRAFGSYHTPMFTTDWATSETFY